MAGYLIALGKKNIESLHKCASRGVYSTIVSAPSIYKSGGGYWNTPQEGTFCDYATMEEGDNVFFFIDRVIYGIGRLCDIAGQDCKFSNYPGACEPTRHTYKSKKTLMLLDEPWKKGKTQRWVCTFEPDPYFFKEGVDMDDALFSKPEAFNMIRVFSGVSFIKLGDEENQALKDVLLRHNQKAITNPKPGINVYNKEYAAVHKSIAKKIGTKDYSLDVKPLLSTIYENGRIGHEMAIEAALLSQLSGGYQPTIDVFGEWDYITHQVVASPFKPIQYVDKMDIFGYSYIAGYDPTKSRYLVIELKKGKALIDDLEQLMKYVDWVKDIYCHGDYSMIEASLVASNISQDVVDFARTKAIRRYIVGRRPPKSDQWDKVKLIKYSYNEANSLLDFIPVK